MEILFIVAAVAATTFGAYSLTPKQQFDKMGETPSFFMRDKILYGDCLQTLKEFDEKARMCVTSPWLSAPFILL